MRRPDCPQRHDLAADPDALYPQCAESVHLKHYAHQRRR